MRTRRLTWDALLTAIALTIFMIEARLPALAPVPGVKLGLANIVTLYAMFALGPVDALGILLARVLLGGMFAGQLMTLLYSLSGGLLCWLLTLFLRKVMTHQQIWLCSIFGAVAHNVGQIIAAIAVTRTPSLIVYLPILMVSGMIAGAFSGFAAQFLITHGGLPKGMRR